MSKSGEEIAKNISGSECYRVGLGIQHAGFYAKKTQVSIHISLKRYQNDYYNSLKNNLKHGQLLINVDYSKNYGNQEQQEIQSACFGHVFQFLQLAVTFVSLKESS